MAAEFLTLLDHSRRQTAEYFQEVEHLEQKRQGLEKALAQATSEKQQLQQHTVTSEKGLLEIESEKQTASLRLLLQQTEVNSLKAKVEEIERIRSEVILSTNDSRGKHRSDCSALLQTIRSSDIRTVADAAREQATHIKKNIEQAEEALTSVRADIYAQKSDISITEATLQSLQREVQELRSQHTNLASSLKTSSSFSAAKGSDLDQLRQAEKILSAKRSALLQETARLRDDTYHGKGRKL
uniref:Uncharacterized protein n=1 Tax=Toxoplasma gondii (strain ATCC 50861 / VEG) TaxID=432359 RepID=A0A0F7V0Q6_TOXGV|nr:TPA: hypothetical protein BN1205_084790 [Toxoplasma gondii VEG]